MQSPPPPPPDMPPCKLTPESICGSCGDTREPTLPLPPGVSPTAQPCRACSQLLVICLGFQLVAVIVAVILLKPSGGRLSGFFLARALPLALGLQALGP